MMKAMAGEVPTSKNVAFYGRRVHEAGLKRALAEVGGRITMAAGDLGNSVMPPLAGSIAVVAAWQLGFGFAIPLFLVAAVGLWVTLPERSSTGSPTGR